MLCRLTFSNGSTKDVVMEISKVEEIRGWVRSTLNRDIVRACILPSRQRGRLSKITAYNHAVIRHWGNNPDMHNLRYQRRNIYHHTPNMPESAIKMHARISARKEGNLLTCWCDYYG